MTRAAVVILNWNGCQHLEKFLPSVVRHTPAWAKVIVADNGSTDSSVEFITSHYPTVEIIRLAQNYGFAGGYNKALEKVSSEYLVLLNSDVEVTEGWLEPLVATLSDNPNVGAIAPKIRSFCEPEKFEYAGAAGGYIDILGYPFCRGRILSTVECDKGQYNDRRDIFWASGAAFCCRAELFKRLGGFDTDYFAHMEEIDLCWRMQLAGYRIQVEPRSVVYHLGGGTLPNNSPRKLYLNYRNNLMMLFKCSPTWQRCLVAVVRPVADMLSALVYLAKGQQELTLAVWQAYKEFFLKHKELSIKRQAVRSTAKAESHCIYNGSIILRYALGEKHFNSLMK